MCLEYPCEKGDLCVYKGYLSKETLSGLKWLGAYMSISAKCCNWDWIEIVTLSTCCEIFSNKTHHSALLNHFEY